MSRNNSDDSLMPLKEQGKKSFWQSPLWVSILSQAHQAETFSVQYQGEEWLFERRKIWRHMTGVYSLGTRNLEVDERFIKALKPYLQPHDLFVQIEPLDEVKSSQYSSCAPFRRFLEPTTGVLLLDRQNPDTLIQTFAEKGRYNIRVAERRGLMAEWVRGDDVCSLMLPGHQQQGKTYAEMFYLLLEETTERDGFSHNSLNYYQTFLRVLEASQSGGLLITHKDGILHAAGIFVYWSEEAIYYYGASSNQQDIRRDHGTYLLQWEAIKEAIKRGCRTYDFLGISSREGDKLAGVTTFKMRFQPQKITLPKEQIILLRPFTTRILQNIRAIKKIFSIAKR